MNRRRGAKVLWVAIEQRPKVMQLQEMLRGRRRTAGATGDFEASFVGMPGI
jgi:hypothetical protein